VIFCSRISRREDPPHLRDSPHDSRRATRPIAPRRASGKIDETIRTGREFITAETGRRGGKIAEFSKTYVVRTDGHARSKTVVVIAEIVGNVCHAITVFNEEPQI
jgi:hypothetical protein